MAEPNKDETKQNKKKNKDLRFTQNLSLHSANAQNILMGLFFFTSLFCAGEENLFIG